MNAEPPDDALSPMRAAPHARPVSRAAHGWPRWGAVIGAAMVVRAIALAHGHSSLTADPDGYTALARDFARTGIWGYDGAPSAIRPPVYPLLLVPGTAFFDDPRPWIAAVHLAASLATVALVMGVGRRASLSFGADIAALVVACDPLLLYYAERVMTETLAALVVVATCAALGWLVERANAPSTMPSTERKLLTLAAFLGVMAGVAALCRPTLAPWVALLGAGLVRWLPRGARAKLIVAAVAGAAAVVAPWAARNAWQFGRPIALTSHGGYTLLLANNDFFYDWLEVSNREIPWDSAEFNRRWREEFQVRSWREQPEIDERCYLEAWRVMRARPADARRAVVYRLRRFWAIFPQPRQGAEPPRVRQLRIVAGFWNAALLACAVGGVWVSRHAWRSPWFASTAGLAIVLSAIHAFYWSDMRMRAPLVPMLALLAGAVIERAVLAVKHSVKKS